MRSSASQIDTFERCARKWAYSYVEKIKAPAGPAAAHGSRVHSVLEDWLKFATPPPHSREGDHAAALIPYLPAPQSVDPDNVEIHIATELGGVPFKGYIDLFVPATIPKVFDHKTTSSLRWALTSEDLVTNVQSTLYAWWAFERTGAEKVQLQWTYSVTKGQPKGIPVTRTVTKGEIEPRIERTTLSVLKTKRIHEAGIPARDVPGNLDACDDYGGCPYYERCNKEGRDNMKTTAADFFSKLQADAEENPPATNGAVVDINPPEAAKVLEAKAEVTEPPKKKKRGRPKGSTIAEVVKTQPTLLIPTPGEPSAEWLAAYKSGFADGWRCAKS